MTGEEWECPKCAALTTKPGKHAKWHRKNKARMGPPGPMGPMGPMGPLSSALPSWQLHTPDVPQDAEPLGEKA